MSKTKEMYNKMKENYLDKVFERRAINQLTQPEQQQLGSVLKQIDELVDNNIIKVNEKDFNDLNYYFPVTSKQEIVEYLKAYNKLLKQNKLQNVIRMLEK